MKLTKETPPCHYLEMSNLSFALNATLPLFIMIAFGFFLRKVNVIKEGFLPSANKFNFTVTLPVLLFVDLSTADIKEAFDLKFLLFCAIVTSIAFWGTWLVAKLVLKNRSYIGEFVQACYRSSAAVMGIALIQLIYGSSSMGGMMILGCVPLYNIYAVIVLQAYSSEKTDQQGKMKKTLLGVIKNPIIIAIILGLIASLVEIDFPDIIDTVLNYLARTATPLALICIGADFNFKAAKSNIAPSVVAAIVKIIGLPIIFLPIAILMGFRNEALIAIFIMLAGPTTPSSYIMAKQYGNEGIITASTVVLTTLFSIVTLTFFVFILKTLNFI